MDIAQALHVQTEYYPNTNVIGAITDDCTRCNVHLRAVSEAQETTAAVTADDLTISRYVSSFI